MMWARLIGSVFFLATGLVGARSANESMMGLQSCFQVARIADAICSKLPNDPAQRLDCFQKTRSAQLECLEHVLSEMPAGFPTPTMPSETTPAGPPCSGFLRLKNPLRRQKQLSERARRNYQGPRRRRPERSDRPSPQKRPKFPFGRSVRIGLSVKPHRPSTIAR